MLATVQDGQPYARFHVHRGYLKDKQGTELPLLVSTTDAAMPKGKQGHRVGVDSCYPARILPPHEHSLGVTRRQQRISTASLTTYNHFFFFPRSRANPLERRRSEPRITVRVRVLDVTHWRPNPRTRSRPPVRPQQVGLVPIRLVDPARAERL